MKNDVVYIDLDRPRELRYGHKALKKLVSVTGKTLEEIENQGFTDFELVEKLIFCGLQKDAKDSGETLKLEQMEDLLDCAPTYSHIVSKFMEAFQAAFGAAPKTQEGNQQPADLPANENQSIGKKVSE